MSFMNDPCRDTRFGEPDAPTPAPVETPRTNAASVAFDAKNCTGSDFDPPRRYCVLKSDMAKLEQELASAQAEIARLTNIGPVSGISLADVFQQLRETQAALAAAQEDKERLANAAEEVLDSFIISKMVEAGHPCPENMVICRTLRSLIDAARAQEGGGHV